MGEGVVRGIEPCCERTVTMPICTYVRTALTCVLLLKSQTKSSISSVNVKNIIDHLNLSPSRLNGGRFSLAFAITKVLVSLCHSPYKSEATDHLRDHLQFTTQMFIATVPAMDHCGTQ